MLVITLIINPLDTFVTSCLYCCHSYTLRNDRYMTLQQYTIRDSSMGPSAQRYIVPKVQHMQLERFMQSFTEWLVWHDSSSALNRDSSSITVSNSSQASSWRCHKPPNWYCTTFTLVSACTECSHTQLHTSLLSQTDETALLIYTFWSAGFAVPTSILIAQLIK